MGAGLIYETAEDLARERALAFWLADEFGWDDPVKLEQLCRVDWLINVWGQPHLCLEAKTRNNPLMGWPDSGAYESYLIDADKLEKGLSYAAALGLPLWLAVQFTDGVYWLLVTRLWRWPRLMHPGRKGRNAPRVCYFIPPKDFSRVGEGPSDIAEQTRNHAAQPLVLADLASTLRVGHRSADKEVTDGLSNHDNRPLSTR